MNRFNKNEVLINNYDKLKIQYIGLYNLLDVLCSKIKDSNDLSEIKELVKCYQCIYKLGIKKGDINE